MRILIAIAAYSAFASAASAQSNPREVPERLGPVIAAERVCGLSYNQEAIAAFIARHVSADDMDFPTRLNVYIYSAEASLESMTPSAITAYCTQIRRIAENYGFTE